jgi:PAS domain-containing protein
LKSVFPLADRLESNTKYSDSFSTHMNLFYKRKEYNLVPIETTFLDKKGSAIPFQVKATFRKGSNDQLMGAIILLKDISERKRLEYEIKEENEKLKGLLETSKNIMIIERLKEDLEQKEIYIESIIESSKDGIIVTDASGYVKRVNNSFAKLVGYQPHELEGKHWAELNPHETKEYRTNYGSKILLDESYIKTLLESMSGLFSEGGIYFDAYLIRKDETLVSVGCGLYWVSDKHGQRNEGFVIVRDLTVNKIAEEEVAKAYNESQAAKESLENVFSTAVDGIVTVNPQGMITRCNEAIEKMTGYTQDELKKCICYNWVVMMMRSITRCAGI